MPCDKTTESYNPYEARILRRIVAERTADLRRANERATEWEGLAAGRLARVTELETGIRDIQLSSEATGKAAIVALEDAKTRILLLEKSLRFIEHVDKTPFYGYTGLQADKDRRGQLPEKAGTRWLAPREIVRGLKLPVVEEGAA